MIQRIVVVTGAGQGIGLGIVREFADAGDIVIGSDFNPSAAAAMAELGVEFVRHDVSREEDWSELLRYVSDRHGRIDVLVNNAGTDGRPGLPRDPVDAPVEDWDHVFAVNSRGAFLGCKHVTSLMTRSGGGAIINLSSVAAQLPTPFLTAYGASKAAVDHLTRSVALHCAQTGMRIRCNAVHPGQVQTPMLDDLFERLAGESGVDRERFNEQFLSEIPLGEFQQPADIAHAVFFLASDNARMITGQFLAVDGGFLLRH